MDSQGKKDDQLIVVKDREKICWLVSLQRDKSKEKGKKNVPQVLVVKFLLKPKGNGGRENLLRIAALQGFSLQKLTKPPMKN